MLEARFLKQVGLQAQVREHALQPLPPVRVRQPRPLLPQPAGGNAELGHLAQRQDALQFSQQT